jgi:hypothetical protein
MGPSGRRGMRCEHATNRQGQPEHRLLLQTDEVALLTELLEAALGSEQLTGTGQADPRLVTFFNTLYADLLETARRSWEDPTVPAAVSRQGLRRLAQRARQQARCEGPR